MAALSSRYRLKSNLDALSLETGKRVLLQAGSIVRYVAGERKDDMLNIVCDNQTFIASQKTLYQVGEFLTHDSPKILSMSGSSANFVTLPHSLQVKTRRRENPGAKCIAPQCGPQARYEPWTSGIWNCRATCLAAAD